MGALGIRNNILILVVEEGVMVELVEKGIKSLLEEQKQEVVEAVDISM